MKKSLSVLLITALIGLGWFPLQGCGDIAVKTNTFEPEPSGSDDDSGDENSEASEDSGGSATPQQRYAVVFGSNFLDPIGSIATVAIKDDYPVQQNVVAPPPGSDAVLKTFDNTLYVVNRFGADNIQVVSSGNNFATQAQFSTGAGTNPQDILSANGLLYVTVLDAQNNPDREDLQIFTNAGTLVQQVDLTPYTTDDGERLARASQMALVGSHLYILLQDLSGAFAADTNGKVVVFDLSTNTVLNVIQLEGRNPYAIKRLPGSSQLLVANTGVFVNFVHDLAGPDGGIEVIDTDTQQSLGIMMTDDDFGGYLGDIEIINSSLAYAIVESNRVASFNPNSNTILNANVYATPGFYLPDIHADGKGHLLITERGDGAGSPVGLVLMNIGDNSIAGTIETGPPPASIATVDIPIQE
ncbi:MAG: hypothetical protein A3B79_04655 [Deltaproteobacteria bacterium RIFCSPHIGHO2_02_FULL_50_15]|nr:MAG: hypothetical protein A3B79_04655 [Deltaproteobacteria bacterium RIFCSPHIGHO2_02_FULL_50_15]